MRLEGMLFLEEVEDTILDTEETATLWEDDSHELFSIPSSSHGLTKSFYYLKVPVFSVTYLVRTAPDSFRLISTSSRPVASSIKSFSCPNPSHSIISPFHIQLIFPSSSSLSRSHLFCPILFIVRDSHLYPRSKKLPHKLFSLFWKGRRRR